MKFADLIDDSSTADDELAVLDLQAGHVDAITLSDGRHFERTASGGIVDRPLEQHVSPVTLTRDANDQFEAWGHDKAMKMYNAFMVADKRVQTTNAWVSGLQKKGYTQAEAQLMALTLLERVFKCGNGDMMIAFMNSFTEKMKQQLVEKISAFGPKAYGLTNAQFNAAVKAAW